jgi:hypothetical protein
MSYYRAYTVGDDKHFIDAAPLICDDDDAAIKQAEQLVNGRAIELWSGARFVIRLENPSQNNGDGRSPI